MGSLCGTALGGEVSWKPVWDSGEPAWDSKKSG